MRYKTIYADPPWPEVGAGKIRRGADKHYPLMPIGDIINMGEFVRGLAHPDGCHLYIWTTNNFLHDALHVMEAWGFKYITVITWYKEGRIGLGQYYRGRTEHCLFGRMGVLPYRTLPNGKRAQGETGFVAKKHEHSRKPEYMRTIIERVSHPPYIELFARPPHPYGWDVWGNEADKNNGERKATLELI